MNNQCLFCGALAVKACCDHCQMNSRSELFVHLLSLLGKMAVAPDYYDQIKFLCDKIRTIEWLVAPIQFDPLIYFDSSLHKIDHLAKMYLLKADPDVHNMIPAKTSCDGNCLYHSIVCLDSSQTVTASELRIRTLLELVQNKQQYSERLAHIVGTFDEAIRRISKNYTFSELYEIAALSNILKCKIRSIYPRIQYRSELDFINNIFDFNQGSSSSNTIHIFWTHTQNEIEARQKNGDKWSPNHFVPLLFPFGSIHTLTDSSSLNAGFLVPPELNGRNLHLNRSHITHSNLDDKERYVSVIYQCANVLEENGSNCQLIKSNKDQNIICEIHIPIDSEKQRAAARERMASKRSLATSEQIEKQRATDRKRKASKRSLATPEQIEKQQAAARERMASKRSSATPEQIEKQQAAARERMASKRSSATPEQIEKQRAAARERMSLKRAASTSEEIERKRVTSRERMASKRSSATSEQIEKQQAAARERMASKRSSATSEQIEKQRATDRERKASKRRSVTVTEPAQNLLSNGHLIVSTIAATTSNALSSNCLDEERSYNEISNQHCDNHISPDIIHQPAISEQNKEEHLERKWPKPVSIDSKIECMKNFNKHMSMSFLAEEICGICNIRCYKRDLHCLPLQKVPSAQLLEAHNDLHDILFKTQKTDKICMPTYVEEDPYTFSQDSSDAKNTDISATLSSTKSSFIYENKIVFYKRGLQHGLNNDRRRTTRCNVCKECWNCLKKEKVPKYSPANKMWIGDIPEELQSLTIPEQRLISLYRFNSCIVKLQSSFHSMDTAQSALRGNCISFPQNVVDIAKSLPLTLDELCESLKIIFIGSRRPEKIRVKHILTVRKKKVLNALRWLYQNNPLYQNITINSSNMNQLPEDDIPECLWATMEISTDIEHADQERANYISDPLQTVQKFKDNTTVALTTSAVLDVNGVSVSYEDVTKCLLEKVKVGRKDKTDTTGMAEKHGEDVVYMIPRGDKPANEYLNPELLMGMFPTLFPYGCGGLEDPNRPVKVSLVEHIRYLLSLEDRRFEENDSFIFIVFNILQRRTACFHAQLMTTRPYFQQSAHTLEKLTSNDVETALLNISKQTNSSVVDPRINLLMKHIKAVGGRVMDSAHSRSALRTKIHALCFYLGLPSLFVTINPADIHSPVALYFAGIDLNFDKILAENMLTTYERAHIIATHPVAAAKFFNILIKNLLKCLILGGIVGPTSAYFGTVESQGRGSLHLHLLIWLDHDFTPAQLKEKIQDSEFREKLLSYIEDVVKEDLDLFQDKSNESTQVIPIETKTNNINPACLPIPNPNSANFIQMFHKDIIQLVKTVNIHKHSPTCYKYSKGKSDDTKKCRMGMPRKLIVASNIDPITGEIVMRRSHPWINNFNEWLIAACRSNMDIKFIWSGSDAKALVYYITDYVTKSNLSFYDMFALAQQGIKSIEQREAKHVSENVIENSRKLVSRCYNMIATHQEVSGVQVASYLMNYGDHYTTHTFKNLFLIAIENYLQMELNKERQSIQFVETKNADELSDVLHQDEHQEIADTEEGFLLEPVKDGKEYVLVNSRLDYQHRSKDLNEMCLYEFVSNYHKKIIDQSDRRILKNALAADGERLTTKGTKMNERHTFERVHPQSSSHILIKRSNPVVPVLLGPQIPRHDREDTRERYHRALLTLFVPWRAVQDVCHVNETWSEAFETRKSLISLRAHKIIQNIQLLHECKKQRDEHLLQVINQEQTHDAVDPILLPNGPTDDNADNDDCSADELLQMLSVSNENTIKMSLETLNTREQRYIDEALHSIDNTDRFFMINHNRNSKITCHGATIDPNIFVESTPDLVSMNKRWRQDIEAKKDKARAFLITGADQALDSDNELPNGIIPITEFTEQPNTQTRVISSVVSTKIPALTTHLDIVNEFTLNNEQKLAFMIIIGHLNGESRFRADNDENQLLMCVPGCGGTGKSQLIRAITKYFEVTKQLKMLRKLAPTSVAAAEIDGLTIHSFLGENYKVPRKYRSTTFKPGDNKLEAQWRHVKYLIIDEMSMVGLNLLARLNRVVQTAKHFKPEVVFGGISVIFFGDFLQYSPVLDKPLYASLEALPPSNERDIEIQCAQKIMLQINCAVELTQQMRTDDIQYLELLNRLRKGQSTIEDYHLLCTRVIGNQSLQECLTEPPWSEAPMLVFRNALRTQLNNRAVLNRALQLKLQPVVCVAQDYSTGKTIENAQLRKAILELPDNRTEHLPGYLPLIPGMPVLLTENIATELGLSNGARGIFHQLIYDNSPVSCDFNDENFPVNTKFITQPKYALVEFPNCKLESALETLKPKLVPIAVSEQTFSFDLNAFLPKSTLKAMNGRKTSTKITVKRKALPLVPAYSITTHKSQGQTLRKIIVDLVMPPGSVELASIYVPLSRVKRLQDLLILRPFEFETLQKKPSKLQLEELKRLDIIAKETYQRYS